MNTIGCLKLCLSAAVLATHHFAAVGQDTTPPTLVSASSADGARIGLCYSEAMERSNAEFMFFYAVTDGAGSVGVSTVTLREGGQTVVIDLSRPVEGEFTVQVGFVTDLAGNEIAPESTVTGRVWTALEIADIGDPQPPGGVIACSENQFTVSAGGKDIGGTGDQFTYLYAHQTNNFDVQVRVDGLLFVGDWKAKAGIHIRQSLDARSPFFMAYVTPTNLANQFAASARSGGGQVASDENCCPVDTFPVWLRVKRLGVTLTAYYSRDGRNWSEVANPISMPLLPAVVLVGLGTASRTNGTPTRAEYQDFVDTVVYTNALVTLTQQPVGAVVEEHRPATFSVGATVTGAPAAEVEYQWQAETSPGSGVFTNAYWATGQTFITPFLSTADSGTRFRVLVFVSGQTPVVSEMATVTVVPDVTGPRAIAAAGTRSLREIVVEFSEPLELASAQNPLNYSVAGFTVTNATADASGAKVVLALNAAQVPGSTNLVEVSGVRDLAGHWIEPNPQSIAAPAFILARGFARQELYFGLGNGVTIASLRASPKFPDSPDDLRYVHVLEGPLNTYLESGTRLSGFLAPKVTGSYDFFLSSDDQGEFWLSTNDEPARMVLVCREPQWNGSREWTNTVRRPGLENRSTNLFPNGIPLVAGRLYYFEALAKDGGRGDNLAVAWRPHGAPLPAPGSSPISGEFLAAIAPPAGTIRFLEQPRNFHYEFEPPLGETVYDETFGSGDGGYTVTDSGTQSPWKYIAADGRWEVNGSRNLGVPSWSGLISPIFDVPRNGPLVLRFEHRYSFEYDGDRYDGGQVRLSANGGDFQPVAASRFCGHGYDGILQRGGGILQGQEAFNGDSAGYADGALITSTANLGQFKVGDTLQLQFLGSWDWFTQARLPNWLIDRVSVTEGECALPATFSVVADGALPGVLDQAVHYQWQRDCGLGFTNIVDAVNASYSFVPTPADVACQFRCVVSVPGISATSSVVRVTITPPQMAIRREGPNVVITWTGPGTLQNAQNLTGPWFTVGGVTSNSISLGPTAARRFYRLRVP